MTTLLYIIWFLIPLAFFILALYAKLEQLSKSPNHQRIGELVKQGFFTLALAFVCIGIDVYFIQPQEVNFSSTIYWLSRIMLFPVFMSIAAKVVGGTKPIRIEKTTHVSRKKGR